MTDEPDKPDLTDSDCLEAFDYLYAYLNDELKDAESIAKLEQHLNHCRSCYSRAQMERQLNKRISETGREKPPEKLRNRLRKLMDDL